MKKFLSIFLFLFLSTNAGICTNMDLYREFKVAQDLFNLKATTVSNVDINGNVIITISKKGSDSYSFYDSSGVYISGMNRSEKGYTFYDAKGIRTGFVKEKENGVFFYNAKGLQEGGYQKNKAVALKRIFPSAIFIKTKK